MEEQLQALVTQVANSINSVNSLPEFDVFKSQYLGPHGQLTTISKGIGKLSQEERPVAGKLINQAKTQIEAHLATKRTALEDAALSGQLGPSIDPTLPADPRTPGVKHPLGQFIDRTTAIFSKLGFSVAEGPEIETEWHCFDALNTPDDHPARDAQDTLYMQSDAKVSGICNKDKGDYLLRTHTSSVQIRTLLEEEPPLRIIAPGRVFRRDTVDATHSANFHQVEGLCVDRNVTLADLKAVLDAFFRELFGSETQIRFRPSFFPFTEPSFEVDLKSPHLGKLSDQWIEVLGCGLVDPEVFKSVNLDPEQWSGFAFGLGVERLFMLSQGVDDIRHFYQNDLRFLKQFA